MSTQHISTSDTPDTFSWTNSGITLLFVSLQASGRCQNSFYRPLASIVMPEVFMKIRKFKMAAERDISAAVQALRSLGYGVGNFILFEQEVKDTLNSIFEKHQTEQNVFAQVRLSCIQVGTVIEEEITIWLKSMQRRLRGQMRVRDPWTVVFTRDIPQKIVKRFIEVVQNAVSSFRVSCTETRLTDAISYTKLNRLLRDFARPKESKYQGEMLKL